ncbi:MAG TPA: hypothetical protein VMX58_09560 [Patescibacteria group bacterium]|nr:hypothetical protein [Patescibacteria group bacterium]
MRYGTFAAALCVLCTALLIACDADRGVTPVRIDAGDEARVGEIHNAFVSAYLRARADYSGISREERIRLYVQTARQVCAENGYRFDPTERLMDEFLETCRTWREEGIWDIYDPAAVSPPEAIDRFVEAGVIPGEYAPQLKLILQRMQRAGSDGISTDSSLPTFLSSAECTSDAIRAANDLVSYSCALWRERYGTVPIYIVDPDDPNAVLADKWWKTVLKYMGVGACDGLAGWGAWFAFAGNPFAVGYFGGLASVAAWDAFEERGW